MKNIIERIDTYLIKRYPLIWNTRLLEVTAIALVIHILFFIFGYATFPTDLTRNIWGDSIAGAYVYMVSILISIVVVVLWLVQLFKNNAFKNFYPFSRLQLLGSFLLYLFIIFISTTFYLSYIIGVKTYATRNFSESIMQQELDKSNLAAVFLTYNSYDYALSNRSYPAPFDSLYCVTDTSIDKKLPFVADSFGAYQFYTIKKDSIRNDIYQNDPYKSDVIIWSSGISDLNDSFHVFYNKDKVMDMRGKVSTDLSFYNYSATRFDDNYDYRQADDHTTTSEAYRKQSVLQNKNVYELLQRNNPQEIKKLMHDFLSIADHYGVETNLTEDNWYSLINASDSFKVTSLIANDNELDYNTSSTEENDQATTVSQDNSSQEPKYAERYLHFARLYFDNNELNNVFENIHYIHTYSIFDSIFYVAFWIAFFFASVLFGFRVTGYKEVLFAIIIAIIITVIDLIFSLATQSQNSHDNEKLACYIILFTMVAVFLMSFSRNSNRGRIAGIFLNISIWIFVPFFFTLLVLMSLYQKDVYFPISKTLLDKLGNNTHWLLFFTALICLYFYTFVIKKWKALPE